MTLNVDIYDLLLVLGVLCIIIAVSWVAWPWGALMVIGVFMAAIGLLGAWKRARSAR